VLLKGAQCLEDVESRWTGDSKCIDDSLKMYYKGAVRKVVKCCF
jgi:hypothetical protein